jgi:peptidoglycan/xylan/chitin deacetylase (PgdA/CDA1 family)
MATRRTRLKAKLRSAFAAIATFSGLAALWRLLFARHGVRVLAYHGVERTPTSPFSVSVENFEKQVVFLSKNFDVIDFSTFLKWRSGAYESDKPKIIVTFDDGFANQAALAAPILMKYGVPATFFLIASKLDGRDERFMTARDSLQLLRSNLFQIGSHSLSHVSMARVADDKKREEIGGSKSVLEFTLGRKITYFCYPYGMFNDVDERCTAVLQEAGYALACTGINGVNFKSTDMFRLRRTKVESSDDFTTFSRLVRGAVDGWIFVDYFFRFLQRPRVVRFGEATT